MKANLKAILLAVSLIGASASAYANPQITAEGDTNPSALGETYAYEHIGFVGDGTEFTHWLAFNLESARSELSATLAGSAVLAGNSIVFDSFGLYSAQDASTLIQAGSVTDFGMKLAFGGIDYTGPALLAGGTYYLRIVGTAVSSENNLATYAGTITTAVPEPSTYGMLALGLGLIGFATRSRANFFS